MVNAHAEPGELKSLQARHEGRKNMRSTGSRGGKGSLVERWNPEFFLWRGGL